MKLSDVNGLDVIDIRYRTVERRKTVIPSIAEHVCFRRELDDTYDENRSFDDDWISRRQR